jgi:hypothetical protein
MMDSLWRHARTRRVASSTTTLAARLELTDGHRKIISPVSPNDILSVWLSILWRLLPAPLHHLDLTRNRRGRSVRIDSQWQRLSS